MLGILGVGYGLWWADAAAAAFISIEIIRDGWENLRNSVAQLMNKRPTDIETQREDGIIDGVQQASNVWIGWRRPGVRLREDGDVLTGEAFIVPRDQKDLLGKLEHAGKVANSQDWRLHDINIVPVRSVE